MAHFRSLQPVAAADVMNSAQAFDLSPQGTLYVLSNRQLWTPKAGGGWSEVPVYLNRHSGRQRCWEITSFLARRDSNWVIFGRIGNDWMLLGVNGGYPQGQVEWSVVVGRVGRNGRHYKLMSTVDLCVALFDEYGGSVVVHGEDGDTWARYDVSWQETAGAVVVSGTELVCRHNTNLIFRQIYTGIVLR